MRQWFFFHRTVFSMIKILSSCVVSLVRAAKNAKKDVHQTSSHKLLFEPSISNALLKHLKRKGYKINLIMYNQRNKKNFSYWNLNIYSFWSSIWTFFREFFFGSSKFSIWLNWRFVQDCNLLINGTNKYCSILFLSIKKCKIDGYLE